MKNQIFKNIDPINENRYIKGFNIPENIQVLKELSQIEKQLLTLFYFQVELPPDVFRESIYGTFLQNRRSLMNGLYLTQEKLDKAIANLIFHRLIDDSKYHGMIKSYSIDMDELQKTYDTNKILPADILVRFKQRNIFYRIALLINISFKILVAK